MVNRRPTVAPAARRLARRRLAGALLIALIATTGRAETFKFFGSAGAEWQLTPANAASALNPRNIGGLPYSSGSADAVAFLDASPDSRAWKFHLKLRGDAYVEIDLIPHRWKRCTSGPALRRTRTRDSAAGDP